MSSPVAQTQAVAKPLNALIRNRQFVLACLSSITTTLAFSVYFVTEQWYVVNFLAMGEKLGLIMMVTALPRLIFMLIGGVLTDRFSSTKIMILSSLIRGVLLVVMVALVLKGALGYASLMIFALCFGMLDAIYWPASLTIVPVIVAKEHLTRANSFLRTSAQISMVVGPMFAAMILTSSSYALSFGFVAGLLILSCLLIVFIGKTEAKTAARTGSMFGQLLEGLSYIKGMKTLLTFMVVFSVTNFFFVGPVGISSPLIVQDLLHGDAVTLSYFNSSWSIGLVVGSVLTGLLNLKRRRGLITLALLLAQGALTVLLSQSSSTLFAVIIIFFMGFVTSMVNIPVFTYVQQNTASEKMGRVMGLFTMVSNGLTPLAFVLVSSALSVGMSISLLLMVCGLILFVFCLLVLAFSKSIRTAD